MKIKLTRENNTGRQKEFESLTRREILEGLKCFDAVVLNVNLCTDMISKVIYLQTQSEEFEEAEKVEIFFKIIKAFQTEDAKLKKLLRVYLSRVVDKDTLYMVTNSVSKDITGQSQFSAKVGALRLLPRFVQAQNPVQVERMIRDNLLDKNQEVVEAALLALSQIQRAGNQTLVQKCSSEIEMLLKNDALQDVFYVALDILLNVRQADRILFLKNFTLLAKRLVAKGGAALKAMSDFSVLQMLKACTSLVVGDQEVDRGLLEAVLQMLELAQSRSDQMIKIECARMLSLMDNVNNSSLKPFVNQLLEILQWSDHPVAHYETLKVFECLVRDPYRRSLFSDHSVFNSMLGSSSKMVVSLAITILIQIVREPAVDRLLQKVLKILGDIPDKIKASVIQNCLQILAKFSGKLPVVVHFLNSCLREKGNLAFKLNVVAVLRTILEKQPESTRSILDYLSDYIEDSIHPSLTVSIISLISKFYNRLDQKGNTQQIRYSTKVLSANISLRLFTTILF